MALIFRRVHKTAKSELQLRHVHPYGKTQHQMNFERNIFRKPVEKIRFIKILQE